VRVVILMWYIPIFVERRRTISLCFFYILFFTEFVLLPHSPSGMGWEEVDKAISMCRCAIHGAGSTVWRSARALISARASARGCVCQLPFTRPAVGSECGMEDGKRRLFITPCGHTICETCKGSSFRNQQTVRYGGAPRTPRAYTAAASRLQPPCHACGR
jgi:hypothetical protein